MASHTSLKSLDLNLRLDVVPAQVYGDMRRLQQVLYNFATTSCCFSGEKGVYFVNGFSFHKCPRPGQITFALSAIPREKEYDFVFPLLKKITDYGASRLDGIQKWLFRFEITNRKPIDNQTMVPASG